MRGRNYQQIIACIFLALLMIFEGAFPLSVFAGQIEENSQAITEQTIEENKAEVEALLIYEGESTSKESLEADKSIDYNGYIFKLKDNTTAGEIRNMEDSISDLPSEENVEELADKTLYAADSLDTISEVVPADNIEYIEPDVQCELMGEFSATPNDLYVKSSRTNWPWIKANNAGAWELGIFGQNLSGGDPITVAVIDSGIASGHPDLDYSRIDEGITYFSGEAYEGAEDYVGHGTFVSGVINAAMNNGIGVSGSMPGLEIYPIRVYEKTSSGSVAGGNISDIIRGINRAVTIKADVVNMSLGTKSRMQSLDAACKAAAESGLILVASAGNDGSDIMNYPAGCDGVIGVGSVTEFAVKASTSNYNSSVDATAPGHGVMGLDLGDGEDPDLYYKKGYGTSYSAPMVAALAGMAKSIDRSITVSDFESLLERTSRDCGAEGKDDKYGYGIINFGNMAKLMLDERGGLDSIIGDSGNENQGDEGQPTVEEGLGDTTPPSPGTNPEVTEPDPGVNDPDPGVNDPDPEVANPDPGVNDPDPEVSNQDPGTNDPGNNETGEGEGEGNNNDGDNPSVGDIIGGGLITPEIPDIGNNDPEPGSEEPLDNPKTDEKPINIAASEIKLEFSKKAYTGKALKPAVTVTCLGETLKQNTDYSVSYTNNTKVGKATVTIAGIGAYEGSVKKSFEIVPKGSNIYSCTKYKNALKLKWTKQVAKMSTSRIGGYQVQVAKNASFTKGKKSFTVSGYKNTSKKITKLSRKTNYYTRVRTYMKVGGVTYYSGWSFINIYRTK